MELGGHDFCLEIPTDLQTLPTISQWWQKHVWPNAFIEAVDENEIFIWRDEAASDENGDDGDYQMVHVIVEPDAVSLVVGDSRVEEAKACLAFLFLDWN